MSNGKKSIHPQYTQNIHGQAWTEGGLTKREAFAMAAMQTVLNKYDPYDRGDFDSSDWELTVKNAVGLADALLKELEK